MSGYSCECVSGFIGDGQTCADVDECASADTNTCDANAECSNTEGGYSCSCASGFGGNGQTCADVDECASADTNTCDANAECSNTEGSYSCECIIGFAGDGQTCADVDECASPDTNTCDANAECTNTEGGYGCECIIGFAGDGRTCIVRETHVAGAMTMEADIQEVLNDEETFRNDFKAMVVEKYTAEGLPISTSDVTVTDISAGSVVVRYVVAVKCGADCAATVTAASEANEMISRAAAAGRITVGTFRTTAPRNAIIDVEGPADQLSYSCDASYNAGYEAGKKDSTAV